MGDSTATDADGSDAKTDGKAEPTVCLLEDPTAAEAIAAAGPSTESVDDGTAAIERLSEEAACLVVNPTRLAAPPGSFLEEVRRVAPDRPVVWVTTDMSRLGDGAFGPATTVVERPENPDDWSFLVQKVRAALEDSGGTARGPETYRMLVESARDGLYTLDADARVTYLNDSFAAMLGYDREELLGSHASRTMAEGELERGQRLVGELVESDSRESEIIDMEMQTKSGDRVTVSVNFVVLTDDDGTYDGLMGVVRDITERKQRERELERYETIVETTTEPIYLLDADERFARVNDAMVDELGYDRETLLGSHVSTVTTEAGVRRQEALVAELAAGDREQASTEIEMTTADGTRRRYDISLGAIHEDGRFEGTVVTAHDVTDLREHQRQLSVLDRVLRHNVRNKMSVVLGHASDVVARASPEVARRAEAIEKSATELLELSDSARAFESVFADDARRTTTVDAAETARDVVRELRLEHPAAEIRTTLPASASVCAHETFELALNELVENAVVHSDRPAPTVEVSVTERSDAVEIRVADDGPGLDETDRRALLRGAESPLEHTQGLGLWLVRWSVETADGSIGIDDNDPCGTVVTVRLPAADDDG
ncbi:hypothetical protein BRC88_01760 [Halobacteriales archaeon QS_4_69_225]|nr:MAG: hypothetical protein BRC88_01760 [Halobacteriales archaeon QS_4_69_225]